MSNHSVIRRRWAFPLALLLLAAAGAVWVIINTPWGIGISPDSISYIGGARGLLAGQGYSMFLGDDRYRELVTYMPAMPILLALVGLFGFEPLESARFVQAGLFALNIALVGLLVRRGSGSAPAGLGAAILVLVSPDLLRIHAMAWSESLFIAFVLAGLGFLSRYLDKGRWWTLVLAGAMFGLSYLTRYAGLAFIAAAALGLLLLLQRGSWKQRLAAAAICCAVASIAVVGWMIRNQSLQIEEPRRPIAWHPPSPKEWLHGRVTMQRWFVPEGSNHRAAWITAGAVAMIMAVATAVVTRRRTNPQLPPPHRALLAPLAGIAAGVYLIFLIIAITVFDSSIPFDRRILAPAWILIIVAAFSLLGYPRGLARWRIAQVALTSVAAGFIVLVTFGSAMQAASMRKSGLGYAAPQWIHSETLDAVRQIPRQRRIYTNGADVVLLLTGRAATYLPAKWSAITDQPNPKLEEQLKRMSDDLENTGAVIVLFGKITARTAFLTEADLRSRLKLRRVATLSDGVIYEWDKRPATAPAPPAPRPPAGPATQQAR